MVRYRDDDDSGSSRALLITAGVAAGLMAGAVVAHRLGGWKGVRRLLVHRRSPLRVALSRVLPAGIVTTLLDTFGIDDMARALLATRRRPSSRLRRRRHDLDLDEYELDEVERATAGLNDDDAAPRTLHAMRDELVEADDDEADQEEDEDVLDEIVDDEDEEQDEEQDEEPDEGPDEEPDDDEELGEEEDELVETLTPDEVEGEVLAAFRRHPVLRRRALEIAVDEDGVLELTGWVRRERELRIARRVAARIPGVERVVVDVAVRDGVRGGERVGADPQKA